MAAELVQLETRLAGLPVGITDTVLVDLDDARSSVQLDEFLQGAARRHGRGPVEDYSLRVLDRHGHRVLVDSFRTRG